MLVLSKTPPLSAFQPSPEMVQNALSTLDEDEVNAIDVEKLIGDGDREGVEASEGIIDVSSEQIDQADEPQSGELFDESGELTAEASDEQVPFEEDASEAEFLEDSHMGIDASDAQGVEEELSLDTEAQLSNELAEQDISLEEEVEASIEGAVSASEFDQIDELEENVDIALSTDEGLCK